MWTKNDNTTVARFRFLGWANKKKKRVANGSVAYLLDELARKGEVKPEMPRGIMYVETTHDSENVEETIEVRYWHDDIDPEQIEAWMRDLGIQFERCEPFLVESKPNAWWEYLLVPIMFFCLLSSFYLIKFQALLWGKNPNRNSIHR